MSPKCCPECGEHCTVVILQTLEDWGIDGCPACKQDEVDAQITSTPHVEPLSGPGTDKEVTNR